MKFKMSLADWVFASFFLLATLWILWSHRGEDVYELRGPIAVALGYAFIAAVLVWAAERLARAVSKRTSQR